VVRGRWHRLPRPAPVGDCSCRRRWPARHLLLSATVSTVRPLGGDALILLAAAFSSSRRRSPPLGGTGAGARRGYSLARVRDENGEREKDSTRAAKSEV
jgi:hypothetical protein